MANFLDVTNEVLREMNEVPLTSASFASASGIQQHVKDCVNRAYLDIVNEEPQWPFLAVDESGSNSNNMYGNAYVETVVGQRWYTLKPSSTSLTTDYGYIDWDNFFLTTKEVAGESAPYTMSNLSYSTIESWKDFSRVSENQDEADTQNYGKPIHVLKSPDNRKMGLSPIPNKVYRVWFFAYTLPVELSSYSDEIVFPNTYRPVLLARSRYYVYQFKENPQMSAFSLQDYQRGLKLMKLNLMEPAPGYFKDDRVRFI